MSRQATVLPSVLAWRDEELSLLLVALAPTVVPRAVVPAQVWLLPVPLAPLLPAGNFPSGAARVLVVRRCSCPPTVLRWIWWAFFQRWGKDLPLSVPEGWGDRISRTHGWPFPPTSASWWYGYVVRLSALVPSPPLTSTWPRWCLGPARLSHLQSSEGGRPELVASVHRPFPPSTCQTLVGRLSSSPKGPRAGLLATLNPLSGPCPSIEFSSQF